MKDIKGVNGGNRLGCDECDDFIGKARCDYCDLVATYNEYDDEPDQNKIAILIYHIKDEKYPNKSIGLFFVN